MDAGLSNPLSLVTQASKAVERTGLAKVAASDALILNPVGADEAAADSSGLSVEQAVSSIKGFVQTLQRDLDFDLDNDSGRVVVKVTDSQSGEVIRQIPSEDALRLAESIDAARSLLFKAEA